MNTENINNDNLNKFKRIYLGVIVLAVALFYGVYFSFKGTASESLLLLSGFAMAWLAATIYLVVKGVITRKVSNFLFAALTFAGVVYFGFQIRGVL